MAARFGSEILILKSVEKQKAKLFAIAGEYLEGGVAALQSPVEVEALEALTILRSAN